MTEVSKTQDIRLADVFIVGPVMIYAALSRKPSKELKTVLLVFGVLTILYNGRNYWLNRGTQ